MYFNEIDIHDFLLNYKNHEIIYILNPGNAGDSLIGHGTFQVFDELGLKYQIGNIGNYYENEILFYGGGGNLVGHFEDCKNFLINNKENNHIVLLPCTVKCEDDLLKSFKENITIICREKKSYNYVKEKLRFKNNVYLSKDMAFYIKNINFVDEENTVECGNFFRKDIESAGFTIPLHNSDISADLEFYYGNCTSSKEIVENVSNTFLNHLSKYQIINTDRLHVSIAALLLNKKVNLYSGSYYKNKEVYEYSMKDKYNVRFIGENDFKMSFIIFYDDSNEIQETINTFLIPVPVIICCQEKYKDFF